MPRMNHMPSMDEVAYVSEYGPALEAAISDAVAQAIRAQPLDPVRFVASAPAYQPSDRQLSNRQPAGRPGVGQTSPHE